jgi:DNA-directed RNA polymerase specialized sigma24 family protein
MTTDDYNTLKPWLMRMMTRVRLYNSMDKESIVHDVLLRIDSKIREKEPLVDYVTRNPGFVYLLLTRAAIDLLHKGKTNLNQVPNVLKSRPELRAKGRPVGERSYETSFEDIDMQDYLQTVNDRDRRFIESYLSGETVADIARQTGYCPATVSKVIKRAAWSMA